MNTDEGTEIAVLGLNRLEALDLRKSQESSGARLEERQPEPGTVGVLDPVTLVVLPLGALAIQGLVAWLLKDRGKEEIVREIEVRKPDGTVIREKFTARRKTSTTGEFVSATVGSMQVPLPPPVQ